LTKSTQLSLKVKNSLVVCFIVFNALFLFPFVARAEDIPEVTTIVTAGGDDVSYQIPLTVSVVYDGVTYENVYATTNSVITFGRPDGTYWTYPSTPSISIESKDWWVLPQQMPDTHFIINVSEGGFQVDGNYRPYGTFTGDTTGIIITAQIQTDGTVAYSYAVNGPLAGNERTGAVLTDGTVVPLEEVNIIQVEEAPVLEPEPVNPTPEPEPVQPEVVPSPVEPEPTPTPAPPIFVFVGPIPESMPEQTPEPETLPESNPEPETQEPPLTEPEPQPLDTPEPAPEEAPEAESIAEEVPSVEEELTEEVVQVDEANLETLAPDTPVELSNGVVVTAKVAIAIQLLQDPAAMLQEIFTNPVAALAALGSVGADMTEEVREESEKVIIAAVIAGNIATQAGATAAAVSAYRRKP
jgi:outer membrane biosynthesis protein TonB